MTPLARRLRRYGLAKPYERLLAPWRTAAGRHRLGERYFECLASDYRDIAEQLPAEAPHIVDIGCGLAGIDLLLDRHYTETGQAPTFDLIDRDEFVPNPTYGFAACAAAYNSLAVTRQFLCDNGIAASRVRTVNVEHDRFPSDLHAGLIISLYSWGYHYPVATYLDYACSILNAGGKVILDVRAGTDGCSRLTERFSQVESIWTNHKSSRVACSGLIP